MPRGPFVAFPDSYSRPTFESAAMEQQASRRTTNDYHRRYAAIFCSFLTRG
ncbi:hypothetical protein ALC60_12990 [Trachymyrmex zeteki]|uniref:Uncharacterized protein n=1 Tax=Mycetomoellerius zeteki TaxID=64791 RepID=A0A151WJP2_9HYME|nr:hypothetical protein ALC60_12990 [Trachymyrmex zeteki]